MKTVFSDVFKLSTEKDTKYKYDIMMKLILENETVNLREPIKMYKHRNRFRLVPSGNNKGDGFFSLPSVYINLKRLYPLTEIEDNSLINIDINYSNAEKKFISEFYEKIFAQTAFSTFKTYRTDNTKIEKTPIGPGENASYDISSISSGEDNLSAFVKILLSFMRIFAKKNNKHSLTGLLSIDEFEASLHPIAQLNLFNFLLQWSRRYNVQIILNTHSLYLIQEAMQKKNEIDNGSISVNFITKQFSDNLAIFHNPDFKFAKEELTLTPENTNPNLAKAKILCEDDIAIRYIKKILGSKISRRCEFIADISDSPGTSWSTLKSIAKNAPKLLDDARVLIIFDADVTQKAIGNLSFNKYLIIPSINENRKLPLEKELVNFILTMAADNMFFRKLNKTKSMFLQEFSQFNIPLTPDNIEDTKTEYYKNWYNSMTRKESNRLRDYMISQHTKTFDTFKNEVVKILNQIFNEHGIPPIQKTGQK